MVQQKLVSKGIVLELTRPGRQITMAICGECGHALRIGDRDIIKNLALQKDIFEQNVVMPQRRYARWPHRPALIASEIRRIKGNQGKALDIGCGTGLSLAALGNGWEKHGVELSAAAAEVARRFTQGTIFCGPIERFEAKANSFDLITAFALIEHLSNPKIVMQWIYEHLKPNGLLVLMTGDRESTTALEMGSDWPLYWPEEHVSYFSARSLGRLVEDAGFEIQRKEWRFMYFPSGLGPGTFRALMKIKEIFRSVTNPQHDLFYCYAKKQ